LKAFRLLFVDGKRKGRAISELRNIATTFVHGWGEAKGGRPHKIRQKKTNYFINLVNLIFKITSMKLLQIYLVFALLISICINSYGQSKNNATVSAVAKKVEQQVIEYRHHFHQYPELSNREFKTSDKIVEYLKTMGYKPDQGMAHTGVVAVLDSGKPGPTIGLRADIDGLPVTERNSLSYQSKETSTFQGNDVGVMHACGHDTHISMLLGVAQGLMNIKDQLRGKVVFVFQPAEEGAPPGEEGGAKLMVKEGLIDKYGIDVMFGQHISSRDEIGNISYKFGGLMAAADRFEIIVKGVQAHGSRPWSGVDPIVTSAQIIMGLQTIVSRQTDLTKEAAVITVGMIDGGVRNNIIPEECKMVGTIRTLDVEMQDIIHEKIRKTATAIAESQGAEVEVKIDKYCPVTFNDLELTRQMLPSLFEAVGEENVRVIPAITGAEDFSFYALEVPALFYFVGGRAPGDKAPHPHHSPDFIVHDEGMITGVKALMQLTLDYMDQSGAGR